jgi:uncharacterized protein (TIGR03435 family)
MSFVRRAPAITVAGALLLLAQGPPTFDVVSIKVSERRMGPDYNNRFTFDPATFTARNATLRRLIAEAWQMQVRQVIGPDWLDRDEYDVIAKASAPVPRAQVAPMLRTVLTERFRLAHHQETRDLRVYELVQGKGGAQLEDAKGGFHGTLQQFADLLAVKLSIVMSDDPTRPGMAAGPPVLVLDKTGLAGEYDIPVNVRPEPGADSLSLWQHALQDMGLRLERRRDTVEVLVIDSAEKVPIEN